jgi:excinuclease UvrABC nuclease subunit
LAAQPDRDGMAGKKNALFSKTSIEALAQDKPIVYRSRNRNGTNTYTGVAKKGRVADRLKEHLPGGPDHVPGAASVEIKQLNSIAEARDAEARSIKRSKPRHNKVGK